MNDQKTDVRIYTFAPHAEWQTAIANLAMEGDSYIVPYKISLQDRITQSNGDTRPLKVLVTIDLPLSVEARDFVVLPSGDESYFPTCGEIYYADEFLRLMWANPEISIQTLTQGLQISRLVSKQDVSAQIAKLSPDIIMPQTLTNIRHLCVNMRPCEGKAGKLRRSVLLHALYGVNITQQTTKKTVSEAVSEAVSDVQTVDFGFRDVAHADLLLRIISDPKTRAAVTPMEFAERINEMDELLAEFGRPVVRSVPASVWLRKVCMHVKTSPLYEAPNHSP